MFRALALFSARLRLLTGRLLQAVGLREESVLLLLASMIGLITAAAAVGFHELIVQVRNLMYVRLAPWTDLYGRGVLLLALLPAVGGLMVGILSQWVFRAREGHGVVDVMESVIRSSGFVRPGAAVEKILTSAVTIGSGGSAGAEGPIVQIGAAIASGVGRLFRIARYQMPLLTGCGAAAGISAIFNAPIGGVLFTLEVILQDFSFRTFTPVVLASVIANVTTKAIFRAISPAESYDAIFAIPSHVVAGQGLTWSHVPVFLTLGLTCGLVGLALHRLMSLTEQRFSKLPLNKAFRPALGGLLLGLIGVAYVITFGWGLWNQPKPFAVHDYPLPAFFGDGYGVIRRLLNGDFYAAADGHRLLLLLGFLCIAKLVGTSLTLSSGGSGGVIAPSLFLGATVGGALGLFGRWTGMAGVDPALLALVGMGAVLAAVVHAPLASILILLELTGDHKIILPAMLATITATGIAKAIFSDSIYTAGLRRRGVQVGSTADLNLLRRLCVEQASLEPACCVSETEPFQKILDLAAETGAADFVVLDERGQFAGMVAGDDIKAALLDREAVPLLLVRDLMRSNVPVVRISDDLATAMDAFNRQEVGRLPVCLPEAPGRVIGLLSRAALMRRYQRALSEH